MFDITNIHHVDGVVIFGLKVVATETLAPERRNASALVEVYVTNENDNSPVFQNQSYFAIVSEGINPGLFVQQVYKYKCLIDYHHACIYHGFHVRMLHAGYSN